MKRALLLLLLCAPSIASAQIGGQVAPLRQLPDFREVKISPTGRATLADGSQVILNERGGYLAGATVVVTYTVPRGVAATSDTAVASGTTEMRIGGTARAAQLLGVLTGYGDGLIQPLTQFLRQPEVVAALPGGVSIDAAPFVIKARVQGRVLTLNATMAQHPASAFAPTRNVRPAARPGARDIVMRIYSDFQCPYCQKFERETMPELLRKLPADVRIEFHQFPLEQIHPQARSAAEASECAAQQNQFWAYKDALFQDLSWAQGNPNEVFVKLAGDLKLDAARFKDCLALRGGKAAVDAGLAGARRLGLTGTPTVFVDGYQAGNPHEVAGLLQLIEFARATR